MNKVQQSIYDKVVGPAMKSIAGMVIGEVRSFNSRLHLGSVVYSSGEDGEKILKHGVPMEVTPGIKKSSPFPGDPVLLAFINNNYQTPVIVGILDKEHIYNTRTLSTIHRRKGSNVTDLYSAREGETWNA
jgi:hypothetical protein